MGERARPGLTPGKLRGRAARLMRAERLASAAAPAAAIVLAYLALALFGLGTPAGFTLCLLLAGLALALGMARARWPAAAEVDRRIEAASGLPHRPLAALDDALESGDPLAQALWRAHRQRAAVALGQASAGWPAPGGAARDKWALRAVLLLLLLAGAVIAGPAAPARLAAAFTLPPWPFAGPRVDVWITPPDYANQPPLALAPGAAVTVLPGSRLAILVNGARRLPALRLGPTRFTASTLTGTSHRADATITASGRLLVGPWWHRLGSWRIAVVPPAAPVIAFKSLEIAPDNQLRLGWRARDPYGLASLSVAIAPLAAADALPQSAALPAGTGEAAANLDLADDPLDGLPSRLIFTARNRAGVVTTQTLGPVFTPPDPLFSDPTVLTLFGLRRLLALHPRTAPGIAASLAQLAAAPPSAIAPGADLQLAVLASAMAGGRAGPAAAVRRLGLLIHEIEAGPDPLAAQALAMADQALLRALQRGLHGPAAAGAALQGLLRAIHQALAQHLAAAAPAGAAPAGAAAAGRQFDMSALDRLAQRIAADEAAGKTAQAAAELQALQNALAALQSARPMTAAQAARARAAAAGTQAITGLATAQAALRDATAQGAATPGQQAALAAGLANARRMLAQAGLAVPGLAPAAKAMATSRAALAQPDDEAAEAAETAAIQSLQQAAAALNAVTRQTLDVTPGAAEAGQEGVNGADDEESGHFGLPPANPADAIQQRIIQEDAAPSLPAATHQYLRRLLAPDP